MLPYTVSDSFCVLAEITLQKTPSSAASRALAAEAEGLATAVSRFKLADDRAGVARAA